MVLRLGAYLEASLDAGLGLGGWLGRHYLRPGAGQRLSQRGACIPLPPSCALRLRVG